MERGLTVSRKTIWNLQFSVDYHEGIDNDWLDDLNLRAWAFKLIGVLKGKGDTHYDIENLITRL